MELPLIPQILDALMSGVILVTSHPDYKIVYVNKAFERMSGYGVEELVGHDVRMLQGNTEESTLVEIGEVLRQGKETRATIRSYRKDGSVFWNELFLSPIFNEAGVITHYVGIQNDVTERVLARQDLLFAELSVENASEVIFVVDRQARMIRANQVACERFGYSREELLSMYIYDLFPGHTAETWARQWDEIRQQKRIALKTVNRTKRDQLFPVDVSLNFFTFAEQEYCCLFIRDLTDRERAIEALHASEARLQAVVENLPFDLWVKDRDNRFLLQNTPSVQRWGNLVGQLTQESEIDPAILRVWQEEDQKALAGEVVRTEETYVQEGQLHYFQKIIAPVRMGEQVIGTVGVNVENTEQILAQQALQESEERLRLALRAANMGTWDWHIPTNEVCWSEQVEGIVGLDTGAFGRTYEAYRSLIYPDDLAMVEARIAAAITGETPHYEVLHRVLMPRGNTLWIEAKGSVYRDEQGQPVRMTGTVTDVSGRKKAELALQESEERYRSVIAAMTEGVVLQDAHGVIMASNVSAERILGLTHDQIDGRTIPNVGLQTIHEDGSPFPDEDYPINMTLHTGKPATGVSMGVYKPDGQLTWLSINTQPLIRPGEEKPYAVVASFTDITRRKQAETALRQSEERLRALVENMPILVDAFDDQWQIVLWNKECERVTGYSQEDMVGNPQAMHLLYPDEAYRETMMARWQIIGNDFRDWEWEVTCKDGTRKIIAWSNISKYLPIPGYASWGVGVDVTQRHLAKKALRESEERYRAISELVSDFAYSYRLEPSGMGVQEWITDVFTRVTGYQPEDIRTSNDWRRIIHPDDYEATVRGQVALARGQDGVWELRVIAKDGRILWFRFYGRPIWDEKLGRVSRIYGAAQDITQVKMLEEQLLQAQKMEAIGRLAGGVAHDFNNLLTVILSYGDLLVRRSSQETVDWQLVGRWGQQIKQAAERAAALTQQLLAFSRQQVMEPKIINLNQTVEEMVDMLRRVIGEDVQLQTFLADQLGQVQADPSQMEQVLLNLVVNARDAMPQGGVLTIETTNVYLDDAYSRQHVDVTPGEYVLLAVSDTGIGIHEQTLARIFEPFFTTKEKGKGTGLGLATVHGIVKQSGGHIWVYTEPEKGTVFKVYLPRIGLVADPVSINHLPQFAAQGKETILLVEDEHMVRMLARDVLTLHGYQVLEAVSEKAEQMCRAYEGVIELLLTDVVMPVISGRELAEKLAPLRPQMKVLYMSGYTDNVIMHHGVLKPGIAFLQKPFTPDTLVRKVRTVLDS
jgi:PAS domain S-box-containing protein